MIRNLLVSGCLTLGVAPLFAAEVQVLDWDDLVPEGVEVFEAPVLHGWLAFDESDSLEFLGDEFGTSDDSMDLFGNDLLSDEFFSDDLFDGQGGFSGFSYPPAASRVVDELDGRLVRLPGFIVPLDVDDVGNITEFFLVPYFGACIHVPPPPPNQLVHVVPEEAFPLHAFWDPFWIEGTIRTERRENLLGLAGYTMTASAIEIYDY